MLEGGFILLHRSILRWEWYGDLNTARLFIHLLLTVNYEPQRWQGIAVERGQRVASLAKLADETGLTVKQVRTALEHLKRTGEVTHTATSKYGLFTVNHYDRYQPRGEPEGPRPGMENGIQGAGGGQAKGSNGRKNKKAEKESEAPTAAPGEKRAGGEMQAERTRGTGGTGTEPAGGAVQPERACGTDAGAGTAAAKRPARADKAKFGEFENVLLDGREHGKLVDSLGDTGASEYMGYLNEAYANRSNLLQQNYNDALAQLQASYDSGARGVNRNADSAQQQAYINYMMSKRDLPQALAAQGLTGGMSESALAGMYNSYGNNRNTIDRGRNESLAALLDTLNSNRSSALQSYNSQLSAAEQQKMAYQMQLEQALANGSAEILQNKYDTLQNLDNAYAQQILALQQAAAQAAQKRW